MTDPLQAYLPIASAGPAAASQPVAAAGRVAGQDFKSILVDSLNEVNRLQTEADAGVQRLITGETNNVAEVMSAVNKAGIAFDLLMEVRNKLTEAYQEIKQMQI